MMNQLLFLGKVLLVSLLLTFIIKYVAPVLSIPATPTSALLAVIGVPLGVGGILVWRMLFPNPARS